VRVLGKLCGADPKELEKLILSEGFAIDSNLDVPSKSIFDRTSTPRAARNDDGDHRYCNHVSHRCWLDLMFMPLSESLVLRG
jgi:hypothetical protein